MTDVTGYAPGVSRRLPALADKLSSIQWDLPPGVVVVLYQHADGTGRHIGLWSRGEFSRLSRWDINDKVSSWAWFHVGDPDHGRLAATVTKRHQSGTPCGCKRHGARS